MSSTGRGSARESFDAYQSPGWTVDRLLEVAVLPVGGTWLEPCAGEGRIIERVNASTMPRITWHAWDIQERYREPLEQLGAKTWIGNMLDSPNWPFWAHPDGAPPTPFDVVITNPPYSIAMDVLITARLLAPIVVLLLRRNFIGSAKRHAYLSQHMPDEYLLPDRPSFIWSHKYTLGCSVCGRDVIVREKVPAGQKALPVGAVHPSRTEHCGPSLRIVHVDTSTSDSAEYCWCVWTPKSGPVGSTRMLELTSKDERARWQR